MVISMLIIMTPFSSALLDWEEEEQEAQTGESIIVNVGGYDPAVLPSSVIEDGDVPVYFYLTGMTPGTLIRSTSNIEPLYGNVDIKHVYIRPEDEETLNYVRGNPKYVKPRKLSIDNLGYLIVTLKQIRKEARKSVHKIVLKKSPTKISQLMRKADLIICTGGVISNEAVRTKTPAIVISQNEAEDRNTKGLEAKKVVERIGLQQNLSEKKLAQAIALLLNDFRKRKQLSENARNFIDCKGSQRISDLLFAKLEEKKITLKKADFSHCRKAFEWRNDELTRENSLDSGVIKWADHVKWFRKTLVGSNRILFSAFNQK